MQDLSGENDDALLRKRQEKKKKQIDRHSRFLEENLQTEKDAYIFFQSYIFKIIPITLLQNFSELKRTA